MLVATADVAGTQVFAGYLLHSGVFPHAKIQQIAAAQEFRGRGAASALMRAFASDLEKKSFLFIRADIASDLPVALSFYAKHSFENVLERPGGKSRGRTIQIHSRTLNTDSLFSLGTGGSETSVSASTRRRRSDGLPVFAFDLNVYFDLVRQREQTQNARQLFGEALGHTIRLAVADEFVAELQRTSTSSRADPVLQMALQLPRLPKPDNRELEIAADRIFAIVFLASGAKGAERPQARSDARHLAHAALVGASAFVTRDVSILNARNELLDEFGIDIATVEEVLDLLPPVPDVLDSVILHGGQFDPVTIERAELADYLVQSEVASSIIEEFAPKRALTDFVVYRGIKCDQAILGVSAVRLPRAVDPIARIMIHLKSGHADAELFAEYLLDAAVGLACSNAPVAIELAYIAGQSLVNKVATTRGFYRGRHELFFSKIAIGRPFTPESWPALTQQIRRRTGLTIPSNLTALSERIDVLSPDGVALQIDATALEVMIGPTLIVWPGREGVIVPIGRAYADELLGTATQANFAFIPNKSAAFVSIRGYVNSPRTSAMMRTGSPMIFYESKRSGNGRGAAVAVARILNSVVVKKSLLNPKTDRRLVVESVEDFSSSDDVLLTVFDSLMALPNPVSFDVLKSLDAVGGANLVSAASLTSNKIASILNLGWSFGKVR